MKKKSMVKLLVSLFFIAAFVLWTVLVRFVDIRAIGPEGSVVGFAVFNRAVHEFFGVNLLLYNITDWAGLFPIAVAFVYAVMGFVQLVKRRSLLQVDGSILAMGVFYILVIGVYFFFEVLVINYRPVLIEGVLEASYPSSTTLLVTCVIPTAVLEINTRIKEWKIKLCVSILAWTFVVFTVVARLVSGVHWATDIIGGILISAGLVLFYTWIAESILKKR